MASVARTDPKVFAKDVVVTIEKVAGSGTYVLFGCVTSLKYASAGMGVIELVCRSGYEKSQDGLAPPPTIALEHVVKVFGTSDDATNITDADIEGWNNAGTTILLKYVVGNHTGDKVYSGAGFINGYSRDAADKGVANGGATFNFLAMPTVTTLT